MNKFQMKEPQVLFSSKWVRPAMLLIFGFFAFITVVTSPGDYPDRVNAQTSQKTVKGEAIKGQWVAEYDRTKPGEIYFMFQRRTGSDNFSMNSDNMPLSELQGLTADAISSIKTNVNFNIVREAGTFQCEGFFSNGKGTGLWTFVPNEKFISTMQARGYNLTDENVYRSATHNLTISYIDELKTAGYDKLTFDEIIRSHNHDINAEYIKEVKAMGFERQPLETIIRMRNHDIDAAFVNEMKSAGFENLSIDELIRLQNHDITAAFINDLKAEGYENVSADIAIRLKNHDIDRNFIQRAKAQGYANVSLEELIRLSNRGTIK